MSENGFQPAKRSRFDLVQPSAMSVMETDEEAAAQISTEEIQNVMANVRKQIEEKKRQLQANSAKYILPQIPPPKPVSVPQPLDGKARIAQLQAQIKATLASRPNFAALTAESGNSEAKKKSLKPTPLILNAEGRTIDQTGKEIQLIQRMPTLKANIRAQKKEQVFKLNHEKPAEIDSQFLDTRIEPKGPIRPKRAFKFIEKGEIVAVADRLRMRAKKDLLDKQIAANAKNTGISVAARLSLLSSIVPMKQSKEDEIPEVEWWDSYLMRDQTYEACFENQTEPKDKYYGITHLIEHPPKMKPPSEPTKPQLLPVFLTKKETKKLRRQNRREAWKEKQEKIRMGLEPPPEPKLKMSNMMRVLGQQAVQDPTKIEAHVREQMEKRQKTHEEANASRKLTGEQKKAKKMRKIKEDTSLGTYVTVYRVLNLSNLAKKFKVEANIKQLQMTGVVVFYKNVNVVIAEGGAKQQKKFKRLMLNRVKWNEDPAFNENGDIDPKTENKCFLVWEGLVKKRAFGEIKFKMSPNESFAREIFKNYGVEHYWDLAYSMSILDSADL